MKKKKKKESNWQIEISAISMQNLNVLIFLWKIYFYILGKITYLIVIGSYEILLVFVITN